MFLGLFRIFIFVNFWNACFAERLTRAGGTGRRKRTDKTDHGADIFNVDCRVSTLSLPTLPHLHTDPSHFLIES